MLNYFRSLFKRKRKFTVRVLFKSGQHIDIRCDDFKVVAPGNDLTSYTIEGCSRANGPLYVRLDDISAIYIP